MTRRWLRYARGWYDAAAAALYTVRRAWRERHDVDWDVDE